jgi:hypothetical protein
MASEEEMAQTASDAIRFDVSDGSVASVLRCPSHFRFSLQSGSVCDQASVVDAPEYPRDFRAPFAESARRWNA